MVTRYQKRISCPLMDRIDIHIQVPRVEYGKLRDLHPGGVFCTGMRIGVKAARQTQREGFKSKDIANNADMRPAQVRKYCALDDACQTLMKTAMPKPRGPITVPSNSSARSRIYQGRRRSPMPTLAEVLQYRPKLDMM